MKGDPELDPKGLIAEAYRMDSIRAEECRSIFLDWALSLPEQTNVHPAIEAHLARLSEAQQTHPMTEVLRQGLERATVTGRRGGRRARVSN